MTTSSQITYCAAQARTSDLLGHAAAARPAVQRGPRSTFRPSTWLGRCPGPATAPHPLHSHS